MRQRRRVGPDERLDQCTGVGGARRRAGVAGIGRLEPLCGDDPASAPCGMTASADAGTVRHIRGTRKAAAVLFSANRAGPIRGHQTQLRWSARDAIWAVYPAPVGRRGIRSLSPSASCRSTCATCATCADIGVVRDHVVRREATDGLLAAPRRAACLTVDRLGPLSVRRQIFVGVWCPLTSDRSFCSLLLHVLHVLPRLHLWRQATGRLIRTRPFASTSASSCQRRCHRALAREYRAACEANVVPATVAARVSSSY